MDGQSKQSVSALHLFKGAQTKFATGTSHRSSFTSRLPATWIDDFEPRELSKIIVGGRDSPNSVFAHECGFAVDDPRRIKWQKNPSRASVTSVQDSTGACRQLFIAIPPIELLFPLPGHETYRCSHEIEEFWMPDSPKNGRSRFHTQQGTKRQPA